MNSGTVSNTRLETETFILEVSFYLFIYFFGLNIYFLGIPINYLPDKIRAKLVEFKILKEYISTDGQVKDSILSMPVCFERININEDYKNDPNLNLKTIDGKVC